MTTSRARRTSKFGSNSAFAHFLPLSAGRRSVGGACLLLGLIAWLGLAARARATTYTWTPTVAGTYNWDNSGAQNNWTSGFPNAAGDVANLNINIGGAETINLNQAITLATVNLGDPTSAYFGLNIAPNGGSLTLDNSGGTVTIAKGTAANTAADTISSDILLKGNFAVSNAATAASGALTLSGNISESGGAMTLTKSGAGFVTLSGGNTYTGKTTVTQGALSVSSFNSVTGGSASSSLGAPTTVANGTIDLGAGTNAVTLTYTGSGETTDRVLNFIGTAFTTTLDQSGSGLLKFTSTPTLVANGAKALTFTGSTAGTGEFAGEIDNTTAPNVTTVNKTGTGKWTLSAANTYTGNTTISGGTLQLNNALAVQNSTVSVGATNGVAFGAGIGTFTFGGLTGASGFALTDGVNPVTLLVGNNNTNPAAYSGIMSGAGALTKIGIGTQILSGANSYTGATTINGGVLRVTSPGSTSASSAVAVNAYGALGGTGTVNGTVTAAPKGSINLYDGAVGTLTVNNTLALNGTAASPNYLFFDMANAAGGVDKIVTSGVVTVANAGGAVINLKQISGTINNGTYTLVQGAAGSSTGNYALATTAAFKKTFALSSSGAGPVLEQVTIGSGTAGPAAAFWSGATDSSWGTTGNWNTDASSSVGTGASPGYNSNVSFYTTTPAATNLSTNLGADYEINSLNFLSTATTPVTIAGGTLTIDATNAGGNTAGNGITLSNTSGTHIISANVGLGAAQTWTVGSGAALTVSGSVTDFGNAFTLTKVGAGALTLSGASSNLNGGLTFNDGKLVLSGPNNGLMGTLTSSNGGNAANGWLEVATGANYVFNSILVGNGNNSSGLHLTGGYLKSTGNFQMTGGSNLTGYSTMSGGQLDVAGIFRMGDLLVGVHGGSTNTHANDFRMSGGTVNAGSFWMGFPNDTGSSAFTYVMSGGSFTSTGPAQLYNWDDANSMALVIGGGTFTTNDTANGVQLGGDTSNPSGNGRVFLAGSGVLAANKVARLSTNFPRTSGSDNTIFFNGGTLKALSDNNTDFMGVRATPANGNNALGNSTSNIAYIYAGGATIDTNGFNVTVNPDLVPRATQTANGVGTVTISSGAGSGYSIVPNITFSGGGGSGAVGYATLDSNGGIAAVVITDPGTGYTSPPMIGITGGTLGPGGVAATPGSWTPTTISSTGGGLTKIGNGTLTLAGNNTYTGATKVNAGTLEVNGSNTGGGLVTVASGAFLGGSGTIASTIAGAGTIAPGDPKILSVAQVNPSSSMGFAFVMSATGQPDFTNTAASLNDVLKMTGSSPFVTQTALVTGNNVGVYFDVATLNNGDAFDGAFLSTSLVGPSGLATLLSDISSAAYSFKVLDAAGAYTFEGLNYDTLATYNAHHGTNFVVSVDTIVPSGSSAPSGTETMFTIGIGASGVPEPSTLLLAVVGLAGLGLIARRRRRAA